MFNFDLDRAQKSLVRWVGGKSRVLPRLIQYIPKESFSCYVEPFVGAGSLYFALHPKKAIINDNNIELINTYRVIKDNKDELIELLETFKNNKDFYLKLRALDREEDFINKYSQVMRAARFIYLLKTCYNGLHRVNSKNYFNTPFGSKTSVKVCNSVHITKLSQYLNEHETLIECGDYMNLLDKIDSNSFVYMDPPYAPLSRTSSFTRYGKSNEWAYDSSQQRLLSFCNELNKRGIKFLQSNSTAPIIYELYKNYNIITFDSIRTVSADTSKRGYLQELLICNYNVE